MFTRIYTVHENANRPEPSERMELVREGFSVWAFLFNALWLLTKRLWVPFFIYLCLMVALMEAHRRFGLSQEAVFVLEFTVQLLLGFSAHDIERWALARRGYRMTGVVVAPSELAAQHRAYLHA